MIDFKYFEGFVRDIFSDSITYINYFKEDLVFMDIDCFPSESYKLTLALSSDDVRVATVSKEPELDFSLYDYFFKDRIEAENFLLSIKETGKYPSTLSDF